MQALLLRFLENGEIQSVGSDRTQARVDVRVIAATNRNLAEMVAAGQFREDLLYRLRVIHLHVPPLRERREDIRALVDTLSSAPAGTSPSPSRPADARASPLARQRARAQNVVEQALWLSPTAWWTSSNCHRRFACGRALLPSPRTPPPGPRRPVRCARQAGYSFWEHVYPLFLERDITRHDMRELVRRGLDATQGNYRSLLKLFGMPPRDYKRFLNFLGHMIVASISASSAARCC